jgi:hypothetical protein
MAGDQQQLAGPTLVFMAIHTTSCPQILSIPIAVDSTNTIVIRIDGFTQRTNPENASPYHIGDLYGKIYGTGTYDGHAVSLAGVEKATSLGGPFSAAIILPSDPAYIFPANAAAAGAPFNIPIEPASWLLGTLALRITATPLSLSDIQDTDGLFTWLLGIIPSMPGSVTVPLTDVDGNFDVSWTAVPGASGYEIAEGVEQPDTSIVWGAPIDVGNTLVYSAVGKESDNTYWYRVRAYNPVPNTGAWRTSTNGCLVERPAFKITPDLGWANIEAMFNRVQNRKLAYFYIDELPTTVEEPEYVKNKYSLIFKHDGINYKISNSQIDKFGSNGKHYWRYLDDPVSWFVLSKVPLRIETGTRKAPSRIQPRIIG